MENWPSISFSIITLHLMFDLSAQKPLLLSCRIQPLFHFDISQFLKIVSSVSFHLRLLEGAYNIKFRDKRIYGYLCTRHPRQFLYCAYSHAIRMPVCKSSKDIPHLSTSQKFLLAYGHTISNNFFILRTSITCKNGKMLLVSLKTSSVAELTLPTSSLESRSQRRGGKFDWRLSIRWGSKICCRRGQSFLESVGKIATETTYAWVAVELAALLRIAIGLQSTVHNVGDFTMAIASVDANSMILNNDLRALVIQVFFVNRGKTATDLAGIDRGFHLGQERDSW